jgi:transposase-like protein
LPGSWGFLLDGCELGATEAAILPAGMDLAVENARLRCENARLRMEREILKKTLRIFSEPPK